MLTKIGYKACVVFIFAILSLNPSMMLGSEGVSVVIIGAGPAGLTAGMYAARGGLTTKMYTGGVIGGQLMETSYVENYSGVKRVFGHELMQTMSEQAVEFGVEIVEESIVSVDLKQWPFVLRTSSNQEVHALSLIIATGATPRKLGVPGEEAYWGAGVSSCAICDGYFFKGEDVVVVGGGDSAIEEALQLAPSVKSVTILVRGGQMKAASHMQKKLEEYPNIKPIQYHKQVTQIIGNSDGVNAVELQDTSTGKKSRLATQGIFLAIGHTPNSTLFEGQLAHDPDGYIEVGGEKGATATSVPGVFAAGDVSDPHYKQAIVSAGFGCMAALDAAVWLRETSTPKLEKKLLKKVP